MRRRLSSRTRRDIEDEALAESEAKSRAKEKALLERLKDTGSGFETIVMEGDAVRSAMEQERLNAEAAARGGEKPPAFVLPKEQAANEPDGGMKRIGMIAGAIVLTLLIAVQVVHQMRADLATNSTINGIIGPIYRAVGSPIIPNWDVSGWKIEQSNGTTRPISEIIDGEPQLELGSAVEMIDETSGIIGGNNETLTIFSRISNQSDEPLPYPMISVSLTDRVSSKIGNIVLEPHEYLTDNLDPRTPVPPGVTYSAVIAIDAPPAEATGFQLDVCYRQSDGLLRCAIQSFK